MIWKYEVKTIQYPRDEIIAEMLTDGWEIIWQGYSPEGTEIIRFKRMIKTQESWVSVFEPVDASQSHIDSAWVSAVAAVNPQATLWADDECLQVRVGDQVIATNTHLQVVLDELKKWTEQNAGGAE